MCKFVYVSCRIYVCWKVRRNSIEFLHYAKTRCIYLMEWSAGVSRSLSLFLALSLDFSFLPHAFSHSFSFFFFSLCFVFCFSFFSSFLHSFLHEARSYICLTPSLNPCISPERLNIPSIFFSLLSVPSFSSFLGNAHSRTLTKNRNVSECEEHRQSDRAFHVAREPLKNGNNLRTTLKNQTDEMKLRSS